MSQGCENNCSIKDESSHNSHHHHEHSTDSSCCKSFPNPSVAQNLDEMEFERGIWQAAIDNNVQKITHLINSQKVQPDITDAYGYTALHFAVRHSCLDATKCLIKFGANINCQTRNNRTTPLHRAIMNNNDENLAIIQYLCENGAILMEDSDGQTPLDRAREKQTKDPKYSKVFEYLDKYFERNKKLH